MKRYIQSASMAATAFGDLYELGDYRTQRAVYDQIDAILDKYMEADEYVTDGYDRASTEDKSKLMRLASKFEKDERDPHPSKSFFSDEEEFATLYDEGDNSRNNSKIYDQIDEILEEYGDVDDLITDCFARATVEDQEELLRLAKKLKPKSRDRYGFAI